MEKDIPYIAFESEQCRSERREEGLKRIIKFQFMAFVTVLVLVITGFLLYLNQYDFTGLNYVQDGKGYNNINTGKQGDINNGANVDNKEQN